jgi:hypothetical protein
MSFPRRDIVLTDPVRHSVRRLVLRRAARRYARHGWPVVPGAYLAGDRFTCGPLCPTVSGHPALHRWQSQASTDLSDVDMWWSGEGYGVLLATGHAFDAIEVPAAVGLAAARAAVLGPAAVTPGGRWLFLVRPGTPLRPELERPDVVRHAHGSWIPAPPTRVPGGRVRWDVSPAATGWQLPDARLVHQVLAARLRPRAEAPTFASTTLGLGRAA